MLFVAFCWIMSHGYFMALICLAELLIIAICVYYTYKHIYEIVWAVKQLRGIKDGN